MKKIIHLFTHNSWFKRGILKVIINTTKLQQGRYVIINSQTYEYKKGFVVHSASGKELQNEAGLSEVSKGGIKLNTEFKLPFPDGITYSNGEITISPIVVWHNRYYRVVSYDDWSDWGHYSYYLELMAREQIYA